jgi:protease I
MTSPRPLDGKKVAVLVETEYIPGEVKYYQEEFPKLGASVEFMADLKLHNTDKLTIVSDVTEPGQPVESMEVTVDVGDRNPNDYAIVIQTANYCAVRLREIPPMGSLGSVPQVKEPPAVRFFAQAMVNPRIVKGAMCHALWILTPWPELMRGRRVICHTVVLADIHNAGATFVPDPSEVVVDEDLVTARSFANMQAYFDTLVRVATDRAV